MGYQSLHAAVIGSFAPPCDTLGQVSSHDRRRPLDRDCSQGEVSFSSPNDDPAGGSAAAPRACRGGTPAPAPRPGRRDLPKALAGHQHPVPRCRNRAPGASFISPTMNRRCSGPARHPGGTRGSHGEHSGVFHATAATQSAVDACTLTRHPPARPLTAGGTGTHTRYLKPIQGCVPASHVLRRRMHGSEATRVAQPRSGPVPAGRTEKNRQGRDDVFPAHA